MRLDRDAWCALALGGLLAGAALLTAGCPGVLEDPERFLDGGGPFTCPDVVGTLFVERCGGSICHEGGAPAAGLDLVTSGVAERVVNVKARDCPGTLATPLDPQESLIYQKMLPQPACGSPMPIGRPMLSGDELGCVKAWIGAQAPVP